MFQGQRWTVWLAFSLTDVDFSLADQAPSSTVLQDFDVTPIPIPTSHGSIPTGTFDVSLKLVSNETMRECIVDDRMRCAWDCDVSPNPPLHMNVRHNAEESSWHVSIDGAKDVSDLRFPFYGAQQPHIEDHPVRWALDLDRQWDGRALFVDTTYDKMVLVREEEMEASPAFRAARKRDIALGRTTAKARNHARQQAEASPSERPWLCIWNQTYIQAFIYVELNTSMATTGSSFGSPSATTSPVLPTNSGFDLAQPTTLVVTTEGRSTTTLSTTILSTIIPSPSGSSTSAYATTHPSPHPYEYDHDGTTPHPVDKEVDYSRVRRRYSQVTEEPLPNYTRV